MESVGDYPRRPALVACERRLRVELGGVTLADSTAALRVLETSTRRRSTCRLGTSRSSN